MGSGFAREDIKSLLLSQGRGFVGDAVQTLQELCAQLTNTDEKQILNGFSRQEVLRLLVSEPRIMDRMPELSRLRRQKQFFRRLDEAFQTARLAFAHEEEEQVYCDRLSQCFGENSLRNEIRALCRAYETWLEASAYLDLPLLLRKAVGVLRGGWPSSLLRPQEIWNLSIQDPESLEREFWDLLGQLVTVKRISSLTARSQKLRECGEPPAPALTLMSDKIKWERWHTFDDAAEYLAEEVARLAPEELGNSAILIPDQPEIRRSLTRALASREIPLADPRDPTRLRWDETLKWALLPLEVVASRFERSLVISWLGRLPKFSSTSTWVVEISSRGIRRGLGSYAGGLLEEIHQFLQEVDQELGGKKSWKELVSRYLKLLKREDLWPGCNPSEDVASGIISFLESICDGLSQDLERVGQTLRRAPLFYWLERLNERLQEASPPVERLKSRQGVQIYRLQQAPVNPFSRLWIFGLPPQWLDGQGVGGYWLNDREREVLAGEFAVRGRLQLREERLEVLRSWILGTHLSLGQVTIVDAEYSADGRERESIFAVLKELELHLGESVSAVPVERGSHPRLRKSYQGVVGEGRKIQPRRIELPSLVEGGKKPEISATALDRFSRCSFQALTFHRWNLNDIREPDTELWPDVRGNILHEAVRLLLKSRDEKGQLHLSSEEALEIAWMKVRPKGLVRSERVQKYVKSRLLKILAVFCQKERDYIKLSGTIPVSLDEMKLRLDYPEFSIIGKPDRIDQHAEGLFVMDYKTSGTLPHGSAMLEGYRLQLPFYAIAIEKAWQRSVIGLQFVELDRLGGRKSGILFKEWNGSEAGALTQLRSNSKSLFDMDPSEAWRKIETHLAKDAREFVGGIFEASPKSAALGKGDQECKQCRLGDLCGFRRRVEEV